MHKIGVLGSGAVGETLANGFLSHGYSVMRGSRDTDKLQAWKAKGGEHAHVGTFAETATFGDVVVLAVKGAAAEHVIEHVLESAGESALRGKIVLDATNPIADGPPRDGILTYFTGPNESLMERLQQKAPSARFVKAFSCVGNANMVQPSFGGVRPSMFICGNDAQAKDVAREVLAKFGWDAEDMGVAAAARVIEPLAILWCIPGFLRNEWTHAFKVLHR